MQSKKTTDSAIIGLKKYRVREGFDEKESQQLQHALKQLPDLPLTNPKKQPLTPDTLRTFSGHETLSDQEAENLIQQYDYVSRIFIVFHERFKELCA
jgi:hypothetical protein